jgi:heterodisulfide reductase subunit C
MASNEMNPFLLEVLSTSGGELVLQCYQCGTCSGSCPVIEEMEHGPRRIMHMIQAGMEEEVLTSPDIWRCVSCYACMSRCPQGIEITDLMADLRRLAIQKGYVKDKEAQFGQAFAATVAQHGRMFEPELLIRYYLRVLDVASLVKMVPLGLQMLVKGKLPFLPEHIRNPEDIQGLGVKPQKDEEDQDEDEGASSRRGPVTHLIALLGVLGALLGLVVGAGVGRSRRNKEAAS